MRITITAFFTLLLFFLSETLPAQNIDSLKTALKKATHDTTRCNLLNEIIEAEEDDTVWPVYNKQLQELSEKNAKKYKKNDPLYFFYTRHLAASINNLGYLANQKNDFKRGLEYSLKSLKMQEEINDKEGIAISLNNLGLIYDHQGEVSKALDCYTRALSIHEEFGNKEGIAISLNNLGLMYSERGDIKVAIDYFNRSLKLDIASGDKHGEAISLNNLGYIYQNQGEITKALDYYLRSLVIRQEQNDKMGMATAYNNIGLIYNDLGDIPKALDYYNKSLKLEEEIDNKKGVATSLNNIGNVYKQQADNAKAIEYYNKSLVIQNKINDKNGIANTNNNIGLIHYDKGEIAKALAYFEIGLQLREEINDKSGVANSLNNIGNIFKSKGELKKALDYYLKSLKMKEEINDKEGMALSLNGIAETMLLENRIPEALKYASHSLKLAKELGYPEDIRVASKALSKIYAKMGNYKDAYDMQVLFKQMDDSIRSESNRKMSIQKSFQYAYDKKAAADSIKVLEERKVFDAQMQQGKTQRTALYAGIALIALFSVFMYNRFRVTSKQKQIIEHQKIEVDKQRELADSRREISEAQKQVIQAKQKEILDSIHYAKRIQQAMLTSEEYINHHFKAEYFILYQPKDIVSGDFYWAAAHNNKFYIATADCTGHGVPGAFMSLLNISFLNENVIERNLQEPADILNEQRKSIIKALNPKGSENSKDGMDCVLCAYDLENYQLQFAAANNPLWLIRDNKLTEYKADKMPVGKYEDDAKNFTPQSLELKKGDLIYTFTDGYADQFGGPKGKKFKYKKLERWLLQNHHLPMAEQQIQLAELINNWKGEMEQVDDILMIGVRV